MAGTRICEAPSGLARVHGWRVVPHVWSESMRYTRSNLALAHAHTQKGKQKNPPLLGYRPPIWRYYNKSMAMIIWFWMFQFSRAFRLNASTSPPESVTRHHTLAMRGHNNLCSVPSRLKTHFIARCYRSSFLSTAVSHTYDTSSHVKQYHSSQLT
jgi:hypothetical protein